MSNQYQNEIKNCQNCKNDFTIEPDDFVFYEKIKVPPPTFCPECRLVRRLMWRNERSLYKTNCDNTGKSLVSMFNPKSNFKVYDRDIWWSDKFNSLDYGQDYDFNKSFFTQYKELLSKVPLANLGNTNVINSPYNNHLADSKDCYLVFGGWKNLRVMYSRGGLDVTDCFDLYLVEKSEFCYNDVVCTKSYKLFYSYNTDESLESSFLWHCKNVQNSIGCINLRNKSYCILNQQYTKEEYEKLKKELDLGSYKNWKKFEDIFNNFRLNFPYRYANIGQSQNVTGDNIGLSKNVQYSFDIFGKVEDSKYIIHALDLKEGYDGYGFGGGASLMYEGVDSGIQAANQYFAVLTHSCFDTNYTYMCYNSKNLFGCIGLRNKQYCILNKQYTKEDYFNMVEKIKKHMTDIPYVDKRGSSYKYGEFFPSDLSPFAYNETIAQEYFSLSKEDILSKDFHYQEFENKYYLPTLNSEELPDHIKKVNKNILNDIIACPNKGYQLTQCTFAYKILEEELNFLTQNEIPLPRYCPNCRHYSRLKIRNPYKLWHRTCMCDKTNHIHGDEPCKNEFETSYSPDRPEIVYCEKCYQQEVY